jgi:hypothetical protein
MPYHHFTTEKRYVISHMAIARFSLREIARREWEGWRIAESGDKCDK